MKYQDIERTADLKFLDLCDEIDFWKRKAKHWEDQFKEERRLRAEILNKANESAKIGVAQALMFAMAVSDDKDGNLVIKKSDRKSLAEMHKA